MQAIAEKFVRQKTYRKPLKEVFSKNSLQKSKLYSFFRLAKPLPICYTRADGIR